MAKHAILKTFYASGKWRKLRLMLINDRGPYCEQCGDLITESINIIAHHKIELTPENVKDYNISLNPDLIELVCFDCHNKEHKRYGYNQKHVYIVYGPPLSGKHTFVKHNMKRGDIVVDMDMLYAAVSGLPGYDKPDKLFSNVIGIHNLLIDHIKTRYGKWNNAWVIGGYADKHKRDKLSNDLGAELVYCDMTQEECFERLLIDEDRKYRQEEWKSYIVKWFNTYTV
ncbi:hypothetical protein Amet_2409 [Alkaliphilus metalliredigens QYMF]|uniref:HNH domain-containing protein n=1 Tax=Alkaliphilus metalliredigens (strain QYMF) TaxID=293826 RepID=A6TQU5_ALKMQ|nr:HNH endonuclease [Alkaliphilus metalliredigens]ABR48563.1 hypothetical protein Amet_2409 [Alkaliphilus metalliredigens QYMF]